MLMRLQHKRPDGEVDTYHLKPGRKYNFGRGSACEIRILDLKLSRKHCLFEFQGKEWVVEDLGSTNGARLNGQPLANTRTLTSGSVIEAGTTTLTVSGFIDPDSDEDDVVVAPEQLPLPKTDEAPVAESTLIANEWEPHADESLVSTGALQPRGKQSPIPAPAAKAKAVTPALGLDDDQQSGNSTIAPTTQGALTAPLSPRKTPPEPIRAADVAQPAIEAPASPAPRPGRIKPITIRIGRVDGHDEHPSTPEVEAPAPAVETVATEVAASVAASAPPKGDSPVRPVVIQSTPAPTTGPGTDVQERTFYITVLGKRIGPLTRTDARDLKARELKGTLNANDLDAYPQG